MVFHWQACAKKYHVGLDALRVKKACGQAKNSMHIALVQQLFANGLARTAFKQHVIGQHHCRTAMLLQQGFNVLHKVELLVAGGGPKVIPLNHVLFGRHLAFGPGNHGAAFLAKWRVGQHHIKALARVSGQRVGHDDGYRFIAASAVHLRADSILTTNAN